MRNLALSLFFFFMMSVNSHAENMNLSMNIDTPKYYDNFSVFRDISKTASGLVPFYIGESGWKIKNYNFKETTAEGLPAQIPEYMSGKAVGARILFSKIPGVYELKFSGKGEIDINGADSVEQINDNHYRIELRDANNRFYINLLRSDSLDPISNISLLPAGHSNADGKFNPLFLSGLEPFHSLRFYGWQDCDKSSDRYWHSRRDANHYSQADSASIELAVELANTLKKNAWFCVPYAADDVYIHKMAEYVKNNLDPDLIVYIEYSNELWNFIFDGSQYVLHDGISKRDSELNASPEVYEALRKIQKKYCGRKACHPEKNAYMMARAFSHWERVFSDQRHRLITVAGVQQTWPENTNRILKYFQDETNLMPDTIGIGAYFKFSTNDHRRWLKRGDTTATDILDVAQDNIQNEVKENAKYHKKLAEKYEVNIVVYEGGQHLQPHKQQDWPYNQAVWDAQVHPRIYKLYFENFKIHADLGVKDFFLYTYIGDREQKWGSWGHITDLSELNQNLYVYAPKYKAAIDYLDTVKVKQ
jgi:hypothetical protein